MLEREIVLALREERELEDLDASGEVLTGLDCAGLELRRVALHKCRFVDCDFSGAVFEQVRWTGCDFSNCRFGGSVWRQASVSGCKGDGGQFTGSRWRDCALTDSSLCYANFSQSRWRNTRLEGCRLRRAVLAQADVSGLLPRRVDFQGADFFRTPLKGLDLSDCAIGGLTVSESLRELRGVTLNPAQAVELMPLLGVELL